MSAEATVFVGPMCAGKTTALFCHMADTPGAWLVRSVLDTRGPRVAVPPDVARVWVGASILDMVHELPPGAAVFVDEGFLFADLAAGVEWLCAHGHAVFVASIQYDYNRVWFENVRALVERHAATTYVLAGACATPGCAAPSAFTRRTAPVATRVAIDGAYAPACAACWRPPPE